MYSVREATVSDAEPLITLRKILYRETDFLLLEPDEYDPELTSEKAFLSAFIKSKNSAVFIAVDEKSNLIGFMVVAGGKTRRIAHKATLFIGILKEHWDKGIGKLFFSHLFTWTKTTNRIVSFENFEKWQTPILYMRR
jgi:GNAT superfamily N-acetyltransferase